MVNSWQTGADRLLEGLDPEQRAVATALTGPVAVIAGAGTGKTRAITHRIAYGVATGTFAPNTVLAVTFTTRAAGEMRGRLQQLGVPAVQARTFHSAALRQAQYFWPKAYGGELPAVADNQMSLVAEAAGRLRLGADTAQLRDLVQEISWAKVSNVPDDRYAAVARARRREVAGLEPETVARVFAGYEQLKRDRGRIDFNDILLCTASLLADRPEIADEIRRTYRHLVVDEYQDVSPLQQTLLDLWRGDREELCVVGDPAQTIHSFAGAQSSYLLDFARRHRDAQVIRLVRDYRSTPQVVRVANSVFQNPVSQNSVSQNGAPGGARQQAVELVAQRPAGPDPVFAGSPDEASEAAAVADWLAGLHAEGVDYREMAVLFRVNAQSPAFEQALAERDIPYLVRGAERFYERAEVRQALGALRAATKGTLALTGGAGDDDNDTHGHHDTHDHNDADEGAVPPAVAEVTAVFAGLGWSPTPPAGSGAVRERWESLAALRSVAEDIADDEPAADLAAVVAVLEERARAQHAPVADGVTVSTLHSAKGLEWDAVAIVGAHEGMLPFVLAQSPAEVAEERRLFYVGVTRARAHLRVSWALSRNGGSAGRRPTRFLDGIRPADSDEPTTSTGRRRRRQSGVVPTCRTCKLPLGDAGERKLGRHHACPSTFDEDTLERLREWRREQASEQSLPAYCIFTDATMVAIAEARPANPAELLRLPGLGRVKVDKYGADVLQIVAAEN